MFLLVLSCMYKGRKHLVCLWYSIIYSLLRKGFVSTTDWFGIYCITLKTGLSLNGHDFLLSHFQ